ncbi:hypothetical protein G3I40_40730 [Streptomyces sp. SID14478]|uniref:hypothetical protein n=1 Tax=Streptomyces sp. SID14478 TaxID=2706073 RepID=UPI0013DEFECF|nr:hypothetical protein [Streptomyces sp. SID14478]NEB81494.1 hypothetical protein [Streptomyces sp. SID14478]
MATAGHDSAQMQLNQIPTDPGGTSSPPGVAGGQKDLASSPAEKKAAANAIEQHIEPDTKKAGNHADEQTGAVVKAFDAKDGQGWVTSSAVKKAHKKWDEQVQGLMNRLGSEKSSLRSANSVLQGSDFGVRTQVRASSQLDRF